MGVSEFKAKWGIIDQHYSRFVCVFCCGRPKDTIKRLIILSCISVPRSNSQHIRHTSRLDCFTCFVLQQDNQWVASSKINITVSSKAETYFHSSPPCEIFKVVMCTSFLLDAHSQTAKEQKREKHILRTWVSLRFRGWPSQHPQAVIDKTWQAQPVILQPCCGK